MEYYVGLDVSLKQTSICVVDQSGSVMREGVGIWRECAGRKPGCSRLDGGHQRLDADDVHDAGEIVGQHVQGHFGGDAR